MQVSFFITQYLYYLLPAAMLGYLADLIIGDPHGVWHPVRFIGKMITVFERMLRYIFFCPVGDLTGSGSPADARISDDIPAEGRTSSAKREFIAGIFLVILVLLCTVALTVAVLAVGYRIHRICGLILQSYMCYTILATKSLRVESMKVYTALKTKGIEAGRQAVSMIVGRDTEKLDETGVTKAAVETVAENASDGVVAPLIFLVIGGPILGYLYKAVNTMDSMAGYKNERYRYFGTAAARLDDVLNYLPARISAVLMIAAVSLLSAGGRRKKESESVGENDFRMNATNARKIWKRDRRNHASPNSAQTEAVMAGALGIQLAGDAWYFGVKHEKPTIGDNLRPVETEDIVRANRLMYAASILAAVLFLFIRFILILLFSR